MGWANTSGRVLMFTLAGAVAGLLTWGVSDISGLVRISDDVGRLTAQEAQGYWLTFACWGGFIGLLLSVADGLMSGTRPDWFKIGWVGLLVGIVSGILGGALGMGAFAAIYARETNNPFDFLRNVIGRAAGWAFIGALAGTAPGWRKGSLRVGRNGFLGGLIGGILGGATFEIIPYLLVGIPRPGIVARLFGFVITGAMIGLFVALVQELLKEAWVRVVLGRNEGKEILIEKAETTIGRYELTDIPLFGDPKIGRTHAVLIGQPSGQFLLRDTGESPVGTFVNGQKVTGQTVVRNGDQIQISSKLLVFYERLTKTPTAPVQKDVAPPVTAPLPGVASLGDSLPLPGNVGRSQEKPLPLSNPGTATPIGARLVAVSGPYAGQAFVLQSGSVIGRDPTATIALPADTKASRQHARIAAEGSGFVVVDNHSTNGTFVNGQRVSRQTLTTGDTIVIGTTEFRVE